LEVREGRSAFAQANGLARLSVDSGYGPETQWEPEPVTVTLGGTPVAFPHSAFLQPTREGQQVLIAAMREAVGEARIVADLFAGLGTFTLSLADDQNVYAAEGARVSIGSLKMAANHSTCQIFCKHRYLCRRSLSAEAHNYNHLLAEPTLYYAICVDLILSGQDIGLNLTIAWVYVGLRVLHSLIQVTINRVLYRFAVFALSSLCIIALAIHAALAVFG